MTFKKWNGMDKVVEPTYGIEEYDFYMRFRPDDIWSVYDNGIYENDNDIIQNVEPYGAILHTSAEGKIIFRPSINLYSFWIKPTTDDFFGEVRLLLWGSLISVESVQEAS